MAALDLRPEVEQAVSPVHLPPAQRETVGAACINTGLARDRDAEPGCGDESTFAEPEEPGRVGERKDGAPEESLEQTFEPMISSTLRLRATRGDSGA